MKNRRYASLAASVVAFAMVGCARRPPAPAGQPARLETSAPAPAMPASSPLAKISTGMGMKEVSDLIGQPTDQNSYSTGKSFIPWYFGPDTTRTAWYYKSVGRIVFNGGNAFRGPRVIRVDYDPTERGYSR